MGSLENSVALAAASYYRRAALSRVSPASATSGGSGARRLRARSRVARFLLFEKVDYLQSIDSTSSFFVAIVFVAFLPWSIVVHRWPPLVPSRDAFDGGTLSLPRGVVRLDFVEGLEFEPRRLRERWARERRVEASSLAQLGRPVTRVGVPKLHVGMLQMVSIASALEAIGYKTEVFSFEDGPCSNIWRTIGVPINILHMDMKSPNAVDWLSLMQEPFKSIPVIRTVEDGSLARHVSEYKASGMIQLIGGWKKSLAERMS